MFSVLSVWWCLLYCIPSIRFNQGVLTWYQTPLKVFWFFSLFRCCSFSSDSSASLFLLQFVSWSPFVVEIIFACVLYSFLFLAFCFINSIVFLSSVLDLLLSLSTKCLSKCLNQHKIHQITTIILNTIKILAPFIEVISTFISQILLLLNLFLSPSMARGSLIGKDLLCFPYPLKTNFDSMMAPSLNPL